ncbi:MAG: hypothetical protein PHE83_13725 [Opitutaceae bacterium]|nr:hypothetical protein [Opitutaceae bacterium]
MIEFAPENNAAGLEGRLADIMTGTGLPRILLYDGEQAVGAAAPTGNLIAISSIVSGSMAGNQAVLTVSPLPSLVLATGTPTWARLENGDGRWVLNGPASDVVGEGVLVLLLTPGPYYHGGRIYVDSVVLSS